MRVGRLSMMMVGVGVGLVLIILLNSMGREFSIACIGISGLRNMALHLFYSCSQ
jgi:hypothetical protein